MSETANSPEQAEATAEDGRTRRARDRREQTHEMIVQTARGLFATLGYDATTPSQIAEAAGITRGTFYQHFDGKAEVFSALLDGLLLELKASVRGVDLACEEITPGQQLYENFMRMLQVLMRERDCARLLLVEAVGHEQVLQDRVDAFFLHMVGMIQTALQEGQQAGWVRHVEIDIASWAMIGMVKEVMLNTFVRDDAAIDAEEQERIAMGLFTCCMAGVGSKAVHDAATEPG